ncbi:uncharacterized protein LOC129758163 [Uranotaenia lowii]|uniref:uncharacterized protein LOC129758163 n=1 Tax=Uranotaenia lowii TaxID=190385 RepID=UPI002479B89E|nr:uncharacterized protein LOC129758163 [Uranotaenia lowii]
MKPHCCHPQENWARKKKHQENISTGSTSRTSVNLSFDEKEKSEAKAVLVVAVVKEPGIEFSRPGLVLKKQAKARESRLLCVVFRVNTIVQENPKPLEERLGKNEPFEKSAELWTKTRKKALKAPGAEEDNTCQVNLATESRREFRKKTNKREEGKDKGPSKPGHGTGLQKGKVPESPFTEGALFFPFFSSLFSPSSSERTTVRKESRESTEITGKRRTTRSEITGKRRTTRSEITGKQLCSIEISAYQQQLCCPGNFHPRAEKFCTSFHPDRRERPDHRILINNNWTVIRRVGGHHRATVISYGLFIRFIDGVSHDIWWLVSVLFDTQGSNSDGRSFAPRATGVC